jgi:hypothetical protein
MRCTYRPILSVTLTVVSLGVVVGIGTPAYATSSSKDRPYYDEAKILWESEAEVASGALQNVPLVAAVADLQRGLATGRGTTGYADAVATIRNFESIPLTSESSAQMKKANDDWTQLNVFFDIGHAQAAVLMEDSPKGAYYDIAQKTYSGEPLRNRSGVNYNLLKFAVTDLTDEQKKQPTRAVLYSAAIYDLKNLEGASAQDIASSATSLTNPFGQDILYLNVFFRTTQLVGSGSTEMSKAGN